MGKLTELLAGPGALKDFAFTHTKADGTSVEIRVKIRVLKMREMHLARINGKIRARKLAPDADDKTIEDHIEDARIAEALAMALVDPDDPSKPFATALEIESMLTGPEVAALWKAYEEHQNACGPILHTLSPEDYEALIEVIAKEASADPLLLYVSPLRNAFIISSVRELHMWRTGSLRHSSESTATSSASETDSEKPEGSDGDGETSELAEPPRAFAEGVPDEESRASG